MVFGCAGLHHKNAHIWQPENPGLEKVQGSQKTPWDGMIPVLEKRFHTALHQPQLKKQGHTLWECFFKSDIMIQSFPSWDDVSKSIFELRSSF